MFRDLTLMTGGSLEDRQSALCVASCAETPLRILEDALVGGLSVVLIPQHEHTGVSFSWSFIYFPGCVHGIPFG